MKKVNVFLGSLMAVLMFFSCVKEPEPVDPGENPEEARPEGYIDFSASFVDSKTVTYIENGKSKTEWEEGDEITITIDGGSYTYVAEESGFTTHFAPKTQDDRIRRAVGDVYTLTATYGGAVLATQNIDADGRNDCKKPLQASLDEVEVPGGAISLTFEQTQSLFDFKFAAENITLTKIEFKTGSNPGTITVNFPNGLDLSEGDATAQVVVPGLAFSASNGLEFAFYYTASETPVRRYLFIGKNSQNFKTGKHTRLNMSRMLGVEILSGNDLRELAQLVNNGKNTNHYLIREGGNHYSLGADIDISAFNPWTPIGMNHNVVLTDDSSLQSSYIMKYVFEGNGHTVSGLTINSDTNEGKLRNQYDLFGLFGVVNNDIKDLTVSGNVVVQSSNQTVNLRAGGIASVLMPKQKISNCTSNVTVEIQVLGRNKISDDDVMSAASADNHKWQRVGGIVGECRGNILNCTNNGTVKNTNGNAMDKYEALTNAHYGGIAGHICYNDVNDVTISGCTNNGTLSWGGNCALAFVQAYRTNTPPLTLSQVIQGVSIGGIVGTAGHKVTADQATQNATITISDCVNKGKITLSNILGCNVGGVVGRTGCDAKINLLNLSNIDSQINGSTCPSKKKGYSTTIQNQWPLVDSDNAITYAAHWLPICIYGGVVGAVHSTSGRISNLSTQGGYVRNDSNSYGAVGGIFGFISNASAGVVFEEFENISTPVSYASSTTGKMGNHFGGIVGVIIVPGANFNDPSSFVTIDCAKNRAMVFSTTEQQILSFGGLVGMGEGCYFKNSANYGEISCKSSQQVTGKQNGFLGGLCGINDDYPSVFENCCSYGTLTYDRYNRYKGLGIGCGDHARAINCKYAGTLKNVLNTSETITLTSSNYSTYVNDGVLAKDNVDYSSFTSASNKLATTVSSEYTTSAYYAANGAKADYWQWNYHNVEEVVVTEPEDPTTDPACSLGGTYATVATASHPRLLLNDTQLQTLKTKVTTGASSNPALATIHNKIIALADGYVNETSQISHTFDSSGRRMLSQSQKAVRRIFACAYAYRMTGDAKYLNKVKSDMNQACSLVDWNANRHMLDAAEMCFAVAIGYDWCYSALPYSLRKLAHAKIRDYALTQTDPDHDYPNATNNWNPICFSGMVAGALAIYEFDKTVAANMIESALANNPRSITASYSDGNYPEGYSYWGYATSYQALMNTAIKNVFGTCGALETTVDFSKTASWVQFMNGPTGKAFAYSDCSPTSNQPQYAMWYLAKKLGSTSYLYNELQLLSQYDNSSNDMLRLLPMVPVFAYDMTLPTSVSAPSATMYPSSLPSSTNVSPCVIYRSSWTDSNGYYLGIKAGQANSSHSHQDAGSFVFDAYGKRWSEDYGSCNYSFVEASSIGSGLSQYGNDAPRWKVFINNRFSHSTLMKSGSSANDGSGYENYAANEFAPLTDLYTSGTEKGAMVDMTSVLRASKATRKVVLNPSTGVLTITDIVSAGFGKSLSLWSRILTKANVNQQSGYIELSFPDCSTRYCYTVESGNATLQVWDATNPGGNQTWDSDISDDYRLIGCSFSASGLSSTTIVTKLTPVNN